MEDHFGKETAHAAPPLGPAQNKKSLRTGSEGAGGREGLLTSRENAFLGIEEHPGSFSETERYLSLAKETALCSQSGKILCPSVLLVRLTLSGEGEPAWSCDSKWGHQWGVLEGRREMWS